jgi:hypothetical protein
MRQYEPEVWRDDHKSTGSPSSREQCRLLDLLGRINYRILSGNRVYVEVGGVVYKTIYGGYWRSVFTGMEHYLLHCEQVSSAVWKDEKTTQVDLPIAYSNGGWTTRGHSRSATERAQKSQTRLCVFLCAFAPLRENHFTRTKSKVEINSSASASENGIGGLILSTL